MFSQIEYANKDMLLDLLDKSVQLLFSDRADSQRKACALDKFATAIKVSFIFSKTRRADAAHVAIFCVRG